MLDLSHLPLILIVYVCYLVVLWTTQTRRIYPGIKIPAVDADLPEGAEAWTLDVGGARVEAWYAPPFGGESPAPVFLFSHGNAETIDEFRDRIQVPGRNGFGVLMVEYPGFGRSEGSPTENTVTRAFLAAWDRLESRPDVDPARVVLVGRSMGGAVVYAASRTKRPAAIITLATFKSLLAFTRRRLVPDALVRSPFCSIDALRAYDGPVLMYHGTEDEVVPWAHGEALSKAGKDVTFRSHPGTHLDCPADWDRFWTEAVSFVRERGIA